MININLKSLIKRMNPTVANALESAAGLCVARGHFNVELEHWIAKLLEPQESDIRALFEQFEINSQQLINELNQALDRFKTGNTRAPALAPSIIEASQNGWMLCSIEWSHPMMSSAHLLTAILQNDSSRRQLRESLPSLSALQPDAVQQAARGIIGQTAESQATLNQGNHAQATADGQPASGQPNLDQFTINLTAQAKEGKIDPIIGRDQEIRQCIDILSRRRQNNPILTGEAGVGKTAVVEGLALRIAEGSVPESLQKVVLRTLDLGLLQAGASIKGEFENRLKAVIEEVNASTQPIILFVDEAHTLIGAGGKEGQGDAANLMKPALARGELRTIAATTWSEYKKYFERDPALTRRFQVVKVEEPTEAVALDMMRAISDNLQAHHQVRISDSAIEAAVKLSARYIPSRQLPDKSVSLLDTACARVALSQSTTPAAIEDLTRREEQIARTLTHLNAEHLAMGEHSEQITALEQEQTQTRDEIARLTTQYTEEEALVSQINAIRAELDAHIAAQHDSTESQSTSSNLLSEVALQERRAQIKTLTLSLQTLQADEPLLHPDVDAQAVAEVIANWTGIPVGKMVGDEVDSVLNIKRALQRRVIGQTHALDAIAQSIRTSRAGLTDPRKPIGVFMMVGTSGVGKTETALALADTLFGGEQNLTTINMSEFKEEHKVSMLLGAPPGYVGYGEGGVLTEAVRRKPYSVILLDEMEKAHPGVQDIFYNLFDKGTIKDGEGRDIDFKNTVIIMTSNAGEDAIRAICDQTETLPEPQVLIDSIRPELLKHFKPAFLGRTQLISYYPLSDDNLIEICRLSLKRIERRITEHYGASFEYDEDLLVHIVARSQEVDTGARNIETILNNTVLPALASHCLAALAEEQTISHIHINVTDDGEFNYQLS